MIKDLKDSYKELVNKSDESKFNLREQYFEAFDNALEKNLNEPHWLRDDKISSIVLQSLLFQHEINYNLWSACIMSNHVHVVLSTLKDSPLLNVILQNHKKFTAVKSNKVLRRSGQFWEEESFDTIIRNDRHFFNAVNYCIQNPVKAGLVNHWKDWKWTYLHPDLEREFIW